MKACEVLEATDARNAKAMQRLERTLGPQRVLKGRRNGFEIQAASGRNKTARQTGCAERGAPTKAPKLPEVETWFQLFAPTGLQLWASLPQHNVLFESCSSLERPCLVNSVEVDGLGF